MFLHTQTNTNYKFTPLFFFLRTFIKNFMNKKKQLNPKFHICCNKNGFEIVNDSKLITKVSSNNGNIHTPCTPVLRTDPWNFEMKTPSDHPPKFSSSGKTSWECPFENNARALLFQTDWKTSRRLWPEFVSRKLDAGDTKVDGQRVCSAL